MTRPALVAITLARKPISEGSVAANALRHGTGPINVGATRIAAAEVDDGPSAHGPGGRWPANIVVQHTPTCLPGACHPSCAVADIDAQDPDNRPGSTFFLNLVGGGSDDPSPELIDYLKRMVTVDWGRCLIADLGVVGAEPDAHYHSTIVRGEPTPDQAKDLLRVLLPGGHLFLVAPESRPTGHVGACRVEDAGFEIRDCILWVRDAGHVHYVAKPSTAEREAGLAHLPDKPFAASGGAQNALADAEEDGGGDDAEYGGDGDLGFNRITKRKNVHPTVKPKALMARLLRTVPPDLGPVIDPFMGSGTTMLACLETGHDGIGIEREANYLEIADARVRHWNTAVSAWDAATIESDHIPTTTEPAEVDLNDFLGL